MNMNQAARRVDVTDLQVQSFVEQDGSQQDDDEAAGPVLKK